MVIKKMSKAKYFYVYAVISFEQRLAYIGSRGSKCPPLEDKYMGSYSKKIEFNPTKKLVLSEHTTREEAYKAEQMWQVKFDVAKSPLFVNRGILTSSGFSNYGKKLSEEEKQKISARSKKLMQDENKRREKRESMKHRAKPLSLKNIETGELLEFESLLAASRALNISNVQLSMLRRGAYKRTGNYCLSSTNLADLDTSIKLKYAKTGEIFVFESQLDAAKKIGTSSGHVCNVINGNRTSIKGYCLPETDSSIVKPYKKSIKLLNSVTGEIKKFNKLKDAAKDLEISHSALSGLLNGRLKSCAGYVLFNDENQNNEVLMENIEVAKKKISKPKNIRLLNTFTNETLCFDSQTEAAKHIGCRQSNISCLKTGRYSRVRHYVLAPEEDPADSD
jgi:DNA-binding Xre family transcriptional regulator